MGVHLYSGGLSLHWSTAHNVYTAAVGDDRLNSPLLRDARWCMRRVVLPSPARDRPGVNMSHMHYSLSRRKVRHHKPYCP